MRLKLDQDRTSIIEICVSVDTYLEYIVVVASILSHLFFFKISTNLEIHRSSRIFPLSFIFMDGKLVFFGEGRIMYEMLWMILSVISVST
jgi:hypothetical protein